MKLLHWYCPRCGAQGLVDVTDTSVAEEVVRATKHHERLSPKCRVLWREIGVVEIKGERTEYDLQRIPLRDPEEDPA